MTTTTTAALALQLYTLRGLRLPFDSLLASAAEAGYDGVETVGAPDIEVGAAKEALAAHGVRVCSSHVPLASLEADTSGVCERNLALGNDVVVVPWLPPERRGHDAGSWLALGRELGELALRCREHGVRLLYHNHDFELQCTEGRSGLEWLMEAAGDTLGLEPDLGWIARVGEDPLRVLAAFSGRCPRVHVKDLAPAGEHPDEDGWADVGGGVMDWSALIPACRVAGAEWLVVEHDAPRDPLASAGNGVAYLRTLV